jgi:hypothetical protein
MRHYASPLADNMHIAKKFDTLDPLEYLVEVHDLGTFQQRTTKAAFTHRKKALMTDPEPFLGCTDVCDYTTDPIPDSIDEEDDEDIPDEPPDTDKWTWQKDITTQNVRRALPSLFHSAMEAHLITAPRSQPHHRLSAGLFRIALARRLRLPVHTYRLRCKCKKWLDIFGDHYFDCHGKIPKTTLHNKVRDGFFYVFSDIAAHTSVMAGPQDVFHEPHNVSPSFPTTRPGDIVLRLHNHKLQACAIDISMVASPPHAESYNEQRTKQLRMHTDREIEKWRGMSRPRPEKGKTLDPNLKKHQVISDLLLHGISMIPATVGPLGDLGPMLEMLLYGSFPSQVNYMRLIAKQRKRIATTKEAIMTARSTSKVQALLPAAEHGWRQQYGRRWFGPTYQDMSPLPSARKNIGLFLTRELALQIAIGATRATTTFISHEPPPRQRHNKYVAAAPGGLPLTSDRDCYGISLDSHGLTPPIENFGLPGTPQQELDSLNGELV